VVHYSFNDAVETFLEMKGEAVQTMHDVADVILEGFAVVGPLPGAVGKSLKTSDER